MTAAALMGGGRVGVDEVESQCGESRVSHFRGDTLRVADVMTRPAPVVPSHLLMAAARKIAGLKAASSLLVEVEGRLVGYLDGHRLEAGRDGELVGELHDAARAGAAPLRPRRRARCELLAKHHVACLPVAAGMFVVGTVSRAQLERALAERAADAARVTRAAA